MKKSLVSIIMPVYNAEKFLAEAIESILGQTYQNFELIILDDGSEDNSLNIIKSYATKDSRINTISHENKGLVKTLNEGLKLANGNYICRMDADDISKSRRLEKQVHFLEENLDVVLVGCYFDLLVENGTDTELLKTIYKFQKYAHEFNNMTQQNIFIGHVLLHPTWMFRNGLQKKIGYYADYKHYEDGEYLFRIISKGMKIGVVEEILFQYRIFNSSKSGSDNLKNLGIKEDSIRFHLEYLNNYFNKNWNERYMIWGNDVTGKLTKKFVEKIFSNVKFDGYINSFSSDKENAIYKPDILQNFKNKRYVFIATHSGMKEAVQYLNSIGYQPIRQYMPVV